MHVLLYFIRLIIDASTGFRYAYIMKFEEMEHLIKLKFEEVYIA